MWTCLNLVPASHGTIAPHIKRIAIPLLEGPEASHDHRLPNDKLPNPMYAFVRMVLHLSHLRSVMIYGRTISRVEAELVADVLRTCSHLRSLELSNFILDSFPVLQEVVASCSRLEDLYLSALALTLPSERTSSLPSPPCPPLKLFSTINCTFTERMLAWIGEGAQASQPGCVFIGADEARKHQRRFGSFLRNVGPALKTLCIQQNTTPPGAPREPGELPGSILRFPH